MYYRMTGALSRFEYDLWSWNFVSFSSIAYDKLSLISPTFIQKPAGGLGDHPTQRS